MRSLKILLIAVLVLGFGAGAYAELQNVQVGGSLRIRGSLYDNDDAIFDRGDAAFVEQRTRLNVTADFSDDVSVFVEIDAHNVWGDNIRSFGVDVIGTGGATVTDINLYQGYVEANNVYDSPVRIRIGRQELVFGKEFILGDNSTSSNFVGLSYDGLRLTYANDVGSIDVFWMKVAEGGIAGDEFGDNDIDMYGIYGSYLGIEDITIDAYWIWIREDFDTTFALSHPVIGVGADADLHTVGLRGAGTFGAFDFETELAFQFGDIDGLGAGGGDADFEGWAFNGELGYTFDTSYQPRLYLGGAFLSGEDDGDIGFTRLFSDVEYSEFLRFDSGNLTNLIILRGGISAMPTESVSVGLGVSWFEVDEDIAGSDEELGLETNLWVTYQYSEDLVFRAGWAHLFADDGIEDVNFYKQYGGGGGGFSGLGGFASGTLGAGASDDEDSDYVYVETEISF